ncbi:MAG: flagellar biosynthesis protein FlhB [Succinivibrionaceae bacterium]|nr:flagellar biosynthesis protein FlhB [Succinivibrionaceae bacterium]
MAENSDGQEKTEEPTGKRVEDARKKGQVPRSREMGTFAVLMSGVIGLWVFSPFFSDAFMKIFRMGFVVERPMIYDPSYMQKVFLSSIFTVLIPVLMLAFFVFVCAFIGNVMLGGFNFSAQAAAPKFNKINPLNGIKRIFGVQSVVELIKSILKVTFIGVLAYTFIKASFPSIVALPTHLMPGVVKETLYILLKVAIGIIMAMVPIAALDMWFQKWHNKEQLKMTKQEIKDEMKDTEGKPEVKGRIRRIQYEMATRRMMQDVPQADVVVTNPTHYAVALKYDQTKAHSAPEVVASGMDETALKIKEIARENNVVIVESPALARAIFYSTKVGQQIPEGLFAAVAQVLAYVFQLRMFRSRKGLAPKPLPRELPIPDDLKHD